MGPPRRPDITKIARPVPHLAKRKLPTCGVQVKFKNFKPRLLPDARVFAEARSNEHLLLPALDRLGFSLVALMFDDFAPSISRSKPGHPASTRKIARLIAEALPSDAGHYDGEINFPGQQWHIIAAHDTAAVLAAVDALLRRCYLLQFARLFVAETPRCLRVAWPVDGAVLDFNQPSQLPTPETTASPVVAPVPRPFWSKVLGSVGLGLGCLLLAFFASSAFAAAPPINFSHTPAKAICASAGFNLFTGESWTEKTTALPRQHCFDSLLAHDPPANSADAADVGNFHQTWSHRAMSGSHEAKLRAANFLIPMTESEFQKKLLDGVSSLYDENKERRKDIDKVKTQINDLALKFANISRAATSGELRANALPGRVSERCASHLAGIAIMSGIKQGKVDGKLESLACNLMGIESRTALTSSDIPLPTGYSGEVAELVGMFGTARLYGTILPLGNGVTKLPRLKTDPTFGLIAGSGPVTEKSPQTEWVTFTAEKFGGLVRLPSEMEEDSIVEIGQFLARYIARQISYIEDYNFWRSTGAGSGVNGTAEGLTKSVATDSKTTTSTGLGSPSEFTVTHLRTLRTVPDASALRQGAYYMHPSFEALLAGFNTAGARPYNPQAQIQGSGAQPFMIGPTFDGFPVRWIDVMPVFTTADALSTVHVLFGDASFNYLGIRGGIRVDTSGEAGFTTDEILVRGLERLTIGKMATGCVGGLITDAA